MSEATSPFPAQSAHPPDPRSAATAESHPALLPPFLQGLLLWAGVGPSYKFGLRQTSVSDSQHRSANASSARSFPQLPMPGSRAPVPEPQRQVSSKPDKCARANPSFASEDAGAPRLDHRPRRKTSQIPIAPVPDTQWRPQISRPVQPLATVIVINYNGGPWLESCLASLRRQTIFDQIEVIVADNASPDHSALLAERIMEDWQRGRTTRFAANEGYSGGNNRAANQAQGRYLLFLNNDCWLEPDCLQHLIETAVASGASVAAPLVMDYSNNEPQPDANRSGFDLFGLLCGPIRPCPSAASSLTERGAECSRGLQPKDGIAGGKGVAERRTLTGGIACGLKPTATIAGSLRDPAVASTPADALNAFVASGCALLVDAALFRKLGGFDSQFFMYADEYDLCWRAWVAGHKAIVAPNAHVHHRGAAAVNPRGLHQQVEVRTSDSKRYYANRNNLLVLLKNSQHLLLLLAPLQLMLLAAEAVGMWALTRRWSHVRRAYLDAVRDCWRLRGHIMAERRRLRRIRRHGDFWMLRFLRLGSNRWEELRRARRLGLPKVAAE